MTFNEEKPCTHDETGKDLDFFHEKTAKYDKTGKDFLLAKSAGSTQFFQEWPIFSTKTKEIKNKNRKFCTD